MLRILPHGYEIDAAKTPTRFHQAGDGGATPHGAANSLRRLHQGGKGDETPHGDGDGDETPHGDCDETPLADFHQAAELEIEAYPLLD
ncbi:hypothetical protein LINPERPRIM_LOCUS26255 [Linum perenne]